MFYDYKTSDYVFYESESAIDAVKIELEDTFYHGTGVMLLNQNSVSFFRTFLFQFYSTLMFM